MPKARTLSHVLAALLILAAAARAEKNADQGSPSGSLGIHVGRVAEDLAHHLGLEPGQGVLIGNVISHRSGEHSGLKKHDVITHIDGLPVEIGDFPDKVRRTPIGVTLNLTVVRHLKPQRVNVIVERLRRPRAAVKAKTRPSAGRKVSRSASPATCGAEERAESEVARAIARKRRELRSTLHDLGRQRGDLKKRIGRNRDEQRWYRQEARRIEKTLEKLEDPSRRMLLSRRLVGLMTLVTRLEGHSGELGEECDHLQREKEKIARILEYHLRPSGRPTSMI